MELGHPGLVEKLVARIAREGPISFAAFMDAALYDPAFGYYMTAGPRMGRDGDYYTSLDVHPVFAELIGRQIAQAAEVISPAGEFTIVEMGAGKGLLAKHLLSAYRLDQPKLLSRLRYLLVERSPAMAGLQREHLLALVDEGVPIAWESDLRALPAESITGVFLSNELVDAFPVHRVVRGPLGLRETYVGWEERPSPSPLHDPLQLEEQRVPRERIKVRGRFIEVEAPPFSSALDAYFERVGVSLEIGQRADVNLQAPEWMKAVGSRLRRGLVLTIDYGHPAADLYAPSRRTGTLLCYYRHTVSDTPYLRIGEQDMTAHVDFTSLALAGRDAGLEVTGFTNQLHFLIGLGIESAFAGLDPESPQSAAMRELLRPDGMGTTYKVLVQHKGMPAPRLDGLRSRPYFPDALFRGVNPASTLRVS